MTLPSGIDLTIDWHCHLLPEVDDGPATLEESLAMARCLADTGFRIVHSTPHFIRGSYDNTPESVRTATAQLQRELNIAGIPLELRPGIEYLLDEFFPEQLTNPLPLGESNLLLVEAYPNLPFAQLKEYLFAIVRAGYRPLLAHPERNALLAPSVMRNGLFSRFRRTSSDENLRLIFELRDLGCLFQGNIGSSKGHYGKHVQNVSKYFESEGIYNFWGSDCHTASQCRAILTK